MNISSITYLMGTSGLSAYQVAKGAVVSLTRSLAIDLGSHGIVVNAIAPGWIDTRHNVETMASPEWQNGYIKSGRIPLGRPGQPEEIASMALALASDDCSYMTGQTLIVDGGMCLDSITKKVSNITKEKRTFRNEKRNVDVSSIGLKSGPIASHCVRFGNLVYPAGQVPVDPKTGKVLENGIFRRKHVNV